MIAAIVQARMGSSRLPGKVLADIGGRPMLARQLERIAHARRVEAIVVATTDHPQDDAVAEVAAAHGASVWRGSADDVLDRITAAARAHGASEVVRLTADCPLSDPAVIDEVIAAHLDQGNDLTSNVVVRRFPDGLDVEVLRFVALSRASNEAVDAYDREHVTPFLYRTGNGCKIGSVECALALGDERWTVDYPEDLEFVRQVFAAFADRDAPFDYMDVVRLLEREPALAGINAARRPAAVTAHE